MSVTNKKLQNSRRIPQLTLTDLATFFRNGCPENCKEDLITVKRRLCRAISEKLCFYCLDGKTQKLTSVIYGYQIPDDGIFVEGFVGNAKDIPYIYHQFKKIWPKVQYLSGYRKDRNRPVIFTTEFLERKLNYYDGR